MSVTDKYTLKHKCHTIFYLRLILKQIKIIEIIFNERILTTQENISLEAISLVFNLFL